MLANTDRLDKPLTIGQISGRFQMIIMANVGHAMHEDDPDTFANHLLAFMKRNSSVLFRKRIAKLQRAKNANLPQ